MPRWATDHKRQLDTKASINAVFGLVVAGVGGAILLAHAEIATLKQILYKLELKHDHRVRELEERVAENSAALHAVAAEIAKVKGKLRL